ncbi:hypothetical protein [Aquimarina sp. MMG016]|uniref:hypothetical protein n=1 Tax=Aquimarina sp. MMG016 TaxID=2822690 RepID=UPI001B3A5F16|nr:hypothetical protein [Aquimarina sp. MMG016]MBQ4820589.1 hypothetical protein [Aquimarina sp. MMG016]
MKHIILLITVFIGCNSIAQVYPNLTDLGSLSGSIANTALYATLRNQPDGIIREYKENIGEITKEFIFADPFSSYIINREIQNEARRITSRYLTLRLANGRLPFFRYSRKRTNEKDLKTVSKMIFNVQSEIASRGNLFTRRVIKGEHINLYLNSMETMEKIDRILDIIEDNIGLTNSMNTLVPR